MSSLKPMQNLALRCQKCECEFPSLGSGWDFVPFHAANMNHHIKQDKEYWQNGPYLRIVSPPLLKYTKMPTWLSFDSERYLRSYYEFKRLKEEYELRLIDLTIDLFTRYIDDRTTIRMLDIGSSTGSYHNAFLKTFAKLHITGIDLEPHAILAAQQYNGPRTNYYRADGCHLPFSSDSFDIVFSKNAVEHAGIAMIREMCRVLKPTGVAFLIGPGYFANFTGNPFAVLRLIFSRKEIDVHGFKVSTYRKYIKEAGFRVESYHALCFNSIQRRILQPWARNPKLFLPPKLLVDAIFKCNSIIEKLLKSIGGQSWLWMHVFELKK